MRRWNGWGDAGVTMHLPPAARARIAAALGDPRPMPADLARADALRAVGASRLPAHPLVDTGAEARLAHATGQGFPDLVALRTGDGLRAPDGVAMPASDDEVRALLAWAGAHDARVLPWGGGTSVVGHFAAPSVAPALVLDLARLAALERVDATSRLATLGAGATGPAVEGALRAHGLTLGHYPQSWERSTLGGWIATRSSGQQSLGYGRIEQLFAGGTLVAPDGTLELPPFPASAAGPDLRQLVLGSEGRLGVVTRATVRVSPVPEAERFTAVFFPDWDAALAATRALAQSGIALSMVRTSTADETATSLVLAGRERAVRLLRAYLRLRGAGDAPCLTILGATGTRRAVRAALADALATARAHRGVHAGRSLGEGWRRGRFRAPYLRDVLWEWGYAVDTVETAATWAVVPRLAAALERALGDALAQEGEPVVRFTHLSHVYPTGASVYTTFAFRRATAPDATMARWRAILAASRDAIVAHGGTVSHQHGVGSWHLPWLAAEKGADGLRTLGAAARALDARGVMNPGVLLPSP